MLAEIISVGSELLLGHTINTDAAFLGRELAAMGIDVQNMQTVGDNPERLLNALGLAAARSDVIITSGGLGPTDDDLTKSVIADFAGVRLVEDEGSAKRLLEYFGARKIGPTQGRQTLLPYGCQVFANSVGTAPGCAITTRDNKIIIMLPGPPRELAAMFNECVKPYLAQMVQGVIYSTTLHVFGMGEGTAAEKISDLMASANPSVAPYAHGGEMFIKITAKADNENIARQNVAPLVGEIKSRLGDVVYGRDVPNLEAVVVETLAERDSTIATAESCTGGLLAKRITDRPGASKVFNLGLVTYSNKAKELELAIPPEILNKFGAVSPEIARLMAENVRKLARADFGIGITGIAGPDGGTALKPVGLVYISLSWAEGCEVHRMNPDGRYLGREFVRERASSFALDMLRRYLMGLPLQFDWQ